jgi:hypothetical protein
LNFEFSSNFLTIYKNFLPDNRFTLEFWFKPTSDSNGVLFDVGGGTPNWTNTGHQYVIFLNKPDGKIYFQYAINEINSIVTLTSKNKYEINVWTHLVLTFDDYKFRMYINFTKLCKR